MKTNPSTSRRLTCFFGNANFFCGYLGVSTGLQMEAVISERRDAMGRIEIPRVWEVCPRIFEAVRKEHLENRMEDTGHSFDHPVRTAQYAAVIVDDPQLRRLVMGSAIGHNTDRVFQKQADDLILAGFEKSLAAAGIVVPAGFTITKIALNKRDVPLEIVIPRLRWLFSLDLYTESEREKMIEAVLKHSEINKPDDSDVVVGLKDADRCTCAEARDIMEVPRFWRELPILDPKWMLGDPEANPYRNPKSCLKHLECRYEWLDPNSRVCVRLPKAKVLMERRVDFYRRYIQEVVEQREEIGLWPGGYSLDS